MNTTIPFAVKITDLPLLLPIMTVASNHQHQNGNQMTNQETLTLITALESILGLSVHEPEHAGELLTQLEDTYPEALRLGQAAELLANPSEDFEGIYLQDPELKILARDRVTIAIDHILIAIRCLYIRLPLSAQVTLRLSQATWETIAVLCVDQAA